MPLPAGNWPSAFLHQSHNGQLDIIMNIMALVSKYYMGYKKIGVYNYLQETIFENDDEVDLDA